MCHDLVIRVSNPAISAAISNVHIRFDSNGVTAVTFNANVRNSANTPRHNISFLSETVRLIEAYLDGDTVDCRDIPIHISPDKTEFQRSVWKAARDIPFGSVTTYADLAAEIATRNHARAVGNALGENPVPIIVPCHRVLAAGRGLGGFSAGLAIKQALLALESIHASHS